jgi:GAF domain-containing protein
MFRFAFGSLRFRLILLVLLAILPFLGLILYIDINQRQHARMDAQQNALRLIRVSVLEQEQLFVSTKQLLVAISKLPYIREGDVEACRVLFTDLLSQYSSYTALSLAFPNGSVICSAPSVSTPINFADRPWFQRVLQSKDFVISEYVIGRISGKSIVVLAYPVLDKLKNIQAIIAIGIDLSWLNQIIAEAALPAGSAYTVIDTQGVILARYPDPEKWVGQPMPETPLIGEILAAQGEGTIEAVDIDGVHRLYAFAPLNTDPSSREFVSIGIPESVAYAEANRILVTNLVGLVMVLFLSLVAAWFGGHVFIMRRINLLVQATKRLQSGDLGAHTGWPYGTGELSQLAQAFDQMSETLRLRDAETRQANITLSKLNRALRVISACNQALVRTDDEIDLLLKICQLIVQVGGYRLAWVGYAMQDEGKTVRPVAQAGYEEGYLETLDITWADTEKGQGPTGTAIRSGKTVIARDILTNPHFTPWRGEALKRGYASSIALPIISNTQTLGALNIYAEEVDAFDAEEIMLLEELANDLAFGIVTLRVRTQHKQAQEKIQDQLKNLAALRNIDMAITSSLDLRVIFKMLLDQVTNTLKVDAACILLLQPHTQVLAFTAGKGFRTKALQHTSLRVGEGHAGQAALERRVIFISDLNETENGFQRSHLLSGEQFISYFAAPLVARGHVKGVLEIFHRTHFEPDREWMDFL